MSEDAESIAYEMWCRANGPNLVGRRMCQRHEWVLTDDNGMYCECGRAAVEICDNCPACRCGRCAGERTAARAIEKARDYLAVLK